MLLDCDKYLLFVEYESNNALNFCWTWDFTVNLEKFYLICIFLVVDQVFLFSINMVTF